MPVHCSQSRSQSTEGELPCMGADSQSVSIVRVGSELGGRELELETMRYKMEAQARYSRSNLRCNFKLWFAWENS